MQIAVWVKEQEPLMMKFIAAIKNETDFSAWSSFDFKVKQIKKVFKQKVLRDAVVISFQNYVNYFSIIFFTSIKKCSTIQCNVIASGKK